MLFQHTIPCFKIVGRCGWFPVPLLSYARQIIKTCKSSGFAQRAPQPTEGYDNNDAVHAGRYVRTFLPYNQTYVEILQTEGSFSSGPTVIFILFYRLKNNLSIEQIKF